MINACRNRFLWCCPRISGNMFSRATMTHQVSGATPGRNREEVLNSLRGLFDSVGSEMYDPSSDVTQIEHALQAARLAEAEGSSRDLVAASFLHDIGHLLLGNKDGKSEFLDEDRDHETVIKGHDYQQILCVTLSE